MKKNILAILVFSSVIFTSCYDDDKSATVRINLGNIPIAKQAEKKTFINKIFSIFVKEAYAQNIPENIERVHIAAYKGDKLIEKESFTRDQTIDANGIVVLSIPYDGEITFLSIGEDSTGAALYYGYTKTYIEFGGVNNVTVSVYDNVSLHGVNPSWKTTINFTYGTNSHILQFNSIGIKAKFYIYNRPLTGGAETLIYEGYDLQTTDSSGGIYRLYLEFEAFSIKTNYFEAVNI